MADAPDLSNPGRSGYTRPDKAATVVTVESPAQVEVAALLQQADAVGARLYPGQRRRPISADSLSVPGTHVLVARREGLAAGLCVLFEREGGTAELKRMIVDERARGRGVGAALLLGAEAEARRLGGHTILLEVGIRNMEAQGLYRRGGYASRDVFPPYRPSPVSLFMEKRL